MKSCLTLCLLATPSLAAQQVDGTPNRHDQIPTCFPTLQDQATGNCVRLSSTPTLGMLYPLGPDFFFDAGGALRLSGSLDTQGDVFCDELFAGGNQLGPEGLGLGTTVLGADLHIRRAGSLEVLLEADADGNSYDDQPRVRFSQNFGHEQGFVGFQDAGYDLALRNLYRYAGINFDISTFSNNAWEFRRRATTATDVEARFTFNGNLQLDGTVSTGGADLAEFYPVAGPIEPGDVVAFAGDGLTLRRAHAGAPHGLAGVISSRPGVVLGLSYTRADELGTPPPAYAGRDDLRGRVPGPAHSSATALADELFEPPVDPAIVHEIEVNRRAPLALSGRIPCKVSAENGPIAPGDPLAVASIPGHAMKATEPGAVIGTALEGWKSGEGTILVFANLGWFSPVEDLERRVAELEAQLKGRGSR